VSFSLKDGLSNAPDRIMNRNPANNTQYSRARAYDGGPQVRPEANETGTNWTPYGSMATHPYIVPMPYSMMSVPQAHLYQSAVGLWPANGQADYPNAYFNLMHLQPTSSARPGFTMPTGPNPNMVFFSPPIFSMQTKPLYATGL
jgi:hypothetical protein